MREKECGKQCSDEEGKRGTFHSGLRAKSDTQIRKQKTIPDSRDFVLVPPVQPVALPPTPRPPQGTGGGHGEEGVGGGFGDSHYGKATQGHLLRTAVIIVHPKFHVCRR